MRINNIFLLYSFLTYFLSYGISFTDSSKTYKTKFQFEDDWSLNTFHYPDSGLNSIQHYRNRFNLGNIGLADVNLFIPIPEKNIGFNYWKNNFESYLFNKSRIKYFNTRNPFTELNFIAGSKEELVTRFIHSQNVNERLNFTAEFQRIKSDGFYLRQQSNHTNFYLSSNYLNKKKNYGLQSYLLINSLENSENGGISKDSLFEELPLRNRKLLNINLTNAERKYRNRTLSLKQFLNFGDKKILDDSLSKMRSSIVSGILHSILIEDYSIVYKDDNPTSGFYKTILNDSVKTIDSTAFYRIENNIDYRWSKLNTITTNIGIKHEFINISQFGLINGKNGGKFKEYSKQTINNYILKASIDWNVLAKLNSKSMAEYCVSGYNMEDMKIKQRLAYSINSINKIEATAELISRRADYWQEQLFANNFSWSKNFDKVNWGTIGLSWNNQKYSIRIGTNISYYNNWIYLDKYLVEQEKKTIQTFSAFADKTFRLNHFVFSNKLIYQYVSDMSIIRVPEFSSNHSLYYENTIFKKALFFQLGIDVFYNTAYYANSYNPALGQFYVQSEKLIGNYPYIDLFLNMKISKARVFIKYEHANAGYMQFKYYYTPGNPMNDDAWKFGLIWRFFD